MPVLLAYIGIPPEPPNTLPPVSVVILPAKVALADIEIASVVNLILLLVFPICCMYSAKYNVLFTRAVVPTVNEVPVVTPPAKVPLPAKDTLLPEKVIGELVRVFDVPDPAHAATVPPVPDPSNTDELSTFCHPSVPDPATTYIAQSPTFQSVIPDKLVLPATDTIQN